MAKDRIKMEVPFFQVPNEIFEVEELDVYEKMTYIYLTRCGNNSDAFPSYNTIANKCSMSRRKAINSVDKLKDIGLITKESRVYDENNKRNRSNLYIIHPPSEYDAPPSACDSPPPSECDAPPLVNDMHPINNYGYKELELKKNLKKNKLKHVFIFKEVKNPKNQNQSNQEAKIDDYRILELKGYVDKTPLNLTVDNLKYLLKINGNHNIIEFAIQQANRIGVEKPFQYIKQVLRKWQDNDLDTIGKITRYNLKHREKAQEENTEEFDDDMTDAMYS